MNKALLSENQKDLNTLLKKLLNNVYTFASIKERYFYKSALEEIKRMKEIEKKRNKGIEEFDNNDLLTVINH